MNDATCLLIVLKIYQKVQHVDQDGEPVSQIILESTAPAVMLKMCKCRRRTVDPVNMDVNFSTLNATRQIVNLVTWIPR